MVTALVTGGTGFVGSHLVRLLNEAGHHVRVLHRSSSKMAALAGLQFESVIGGLLDEELLCAASQGCEWVFHVAAVADYWQADQTEMFAVNIEGTRRVLRAARKAGVKRVIFTSSAAAVGFRPDGQPADERFDFNLNPERFPYAYSKLLAEEVCRYAVRTYGQEVVIVNPVIILGPGDSNMLSGRFITEMQRLQWTIPVSSGGIGLVDVRDVARWHIQAAEQGRSGERYLLGTANYRFRDWYAMCAETVQVKAPFFTVPDATLPLIAAGINWLHRVGIHSPVEGNQVRLGWRNMYFDYGKTHRELGPPEISMYQSLADTYRWYLENGYIQPDSFSRVIGWLGQFLP